MKRLLTLTIVISALVVLWAAAIPTAAQDASEVTLTMWTHDDSLVKFFNARAEEWKER